MKTGKTLLLSLLAIAVAAIVAVFFVEWKRAGKRSRPLALSQPQTHEGRKVFATWDDFLASDEWKKVEESPRLKVVFIGMDGATWNVIDPMIEAGELPALERIKKEGSYGTLRSLECYISPPAWVSMMTGVLPSKSGVYTFGKWDEKQHKFNTVSVEDVRAPAVWDIASLLGKRVAVTNVPITYPAQKVNGIMVSGELTPITLEPNRPAFVLKCERYSGNLLESLGIETYSPAWQTYAELYGNLFRIILYDATDDGVKNYDNGIIGVIKKRQRKKRGGTIPCYDFKPDVYSPWMEIDFEKDGRIRDAWVQVKMITQRFPVFKAKFSPVFMAPDDPDAMYAYPDSLKQVLKKRFKYYFPYTPFDKDQIPSFARDATRYASFFYGYEDWDLFMYAFLGPDRIQHREGFSRKTHEVYGIIDGFIGKIMNELPDNSVLVVASDHGFKGYKYSIDMNVFLAGLGLLQWGKGRDIDYDRTLVYYNMYSLFFNHELLSISELKRRGIPVDEGMKARDALMRYLKKKGKALKDPKTGREMPIELFSVPENAVGSPPDMYVTGGYTDYTIELWDYKNPHQDLVRPLKPGEDWAHRRDGVFFIWGKNVRRGYDAGVKDIQDIAPTLEYLLGLPIAGYIDGKVMLDVFEPGVVAERPVTVVRNYVEIAKTSILPDEERQEIEKKLKSLGYIR